jgi:hypothetical protein
VIRILTPEILRDLGQTHAALFGSSGSGKSMFLIAVAEAIAKNPFEGFTFICPHGTARAVAERFANPANGCSHRKVHVLDPSSSMVPGLSPFETYDDSWESCHEASLLWTSSVASSYGAAMQDTPRLETNFYVLGMFAAAKNLTLCELLPALSLAGGSIREFLLANFHNHAPAVVLADLHELAARQPARFLEQIDSCKNRLVRWLGDKRLVRILGQQKGLNARAIMDDRDIVLIDLSSLPQSDAAFLATIITCRYFAAAKRRKPNACARHRLIIDEAAASLCTATAELLDQTRKFGLLGIFSLQRLSQLEEKGEFMTGAVMVNCLCKIVFNSPEPLSARVLSENLFGGYLDYESWKPASVRPVAVGNEKIITRGRAHAEHDAISQSTAETDMKSFARATAAVTASMFSSGAAIGSGANSSFASMPDHVLEHGLPISQSNGYNHSNAASTSRGNSRATSRAQQYSRGQARTQARAATRGRSTAESETESFITRWELLPTQMFSLEETWSRLGGAIQTLPRRECFVKLEGQPPFRARTADVKPAFRSIEFRNEMLPRYLETAARRSPYLRPSELVDAEIAARLQAITTPAEKPEPDFAASEPLPIVKEPRAYAREFHRRTQSPAPNLRVVQGRKDKDHGDNHND